MTKSTWIAVACALALGGCSGPANNRAHTVEPMFGAAPEPPEVALPPVAATAEAVDDLQVAFKQAIRAVGDRKSVV